MAGVTKEQVFAAAEALMGEGTRPTLTNVRARLGGTGSYSTITPILAEWREQQKAPEAPIREIAPDRINERLADLGNEIWSVAQQIATDRLKAEREALEAARQEMELQQAETAEMADQLAAEVEQLRQEKSDLQFALDMSQQTLGALEKNLQGEQLDNIRLKTELSANEKWLADLQNKSEIAENKIAGLKSENEEQRIVIARLELHKEKQVAVENEIKTVLADLKSTRDKLSASVLQEGKQAGIIETLRQQLADQSEIIKQLTTETKKPRNRRPQQETKNDES